MKSSDEKNAIELMSRQGEEKKREGLVIALKRKDRRRPIEKKTTFVG